MAPPLELEAVLPEKVLLVTLVTVAAPLTMAPPIEPALLPEKVLLVTVRVLPLEMAPPLPSVVTRRAELAEKVLSVTVAVPGESIEMAPPPRALLPEKVLLLTLSVPRV